MLFYEGMVSRQRRWMLYLLALFFLGWGFTTYKEVFLGLILGSSIGFFNLWLLQRKINQVGHAAAENVTARTLGTMSRFAGAALAVVVALRYPEHFHMIAVVIGLVTIYFVIMIDFILHHTRSKP
ncbi:ATP synthase protein I [Salirhabdus euzebyi]|uniref:ATP synthase protein I n=1 Tax=Salirhabdus euzebyi TaxID=394506 RepID=A0A841Q6C0_9BACI|nr:ATP synthase subunit I [Salirhabdus euzebyi]MBB6453956.1 ATP synthase protein I [Salirhabdus euzebyi]